MDGNGGGARPRGVRKCETDARTLDPWEYGGRPNVAPRGPGTQGPHQACDRHPLFLTPKTWYADRAEGGAFFFFVALWSSYGPSRAQFGPKFVSFPAISGSRPFKLHPGHRGPRPRRSWPVPTGFGTHRACNRPTPDAKTGSRNMCSAPQSPQGPSLASRVLGPLSFGPEWLKWWRGTGGCHSAPKGPTHWATPPCLNTPTGPGLRSEQSFPTVLGPLWDPVCRSPPGQRAPSSADPGRRGIERGCGTRDASRSGPLHVIRLAPSDPSK